VSWVRHDEAVLLESFGLRPPSLTLGSPTKRPFCFLKPEASGEGKKRGIGLQFKYKHPWMTWGQCWSAAGPEWIDVDWDQAFYGLMIVVLLLFVAGVLFQDKREWVCTRAAYEAIEVKGKLIQATPCIEEINVNTGEKREVKR